MKLVNWNVAGANPRSKSSRVVARAVEIRNRIDRQSPEIVCLTKTHSGLLEDGHRICARPDCGSGIQEGRRKVLLWSREPWERVVDDIGDDRLPSGRFISGITRTSVGEVTVVGLCIPWRWSRTPRFGGVRREWEDHEDYLKHLKGVLSRAPSERFVVMGDFNQCIVKRRDGSKAARRADLLRQAIPQHVKVVTSELERRRTIDHIAISKDMEVAGSPGVISSIPGEQGVSTRARFGVVADVFTSAQC